MMIMRIVGITILGLAALQIGVAHLIAMNALYAMKQPDSTGRAAATALSRCGLFFGLIGFVCLMESFG